MNQLVSQEEKPLSPSQQFRAELDKMADQFAAALPSHIKPEKFQRVVMTAVLSDPDILRADRKSLMESAIRAAQDGLLPDKREGAFVTFNTKVKVDGKDQWIKAVQWMPMVGGIIKRIHQSGDVKMLTARVVYGGDHFKTWIDDHGEHIEYEPAEDQDHDVVRRVFAMATTTDGAVYVEPLSTKDVEKIRSVSRSKDKGPWADWWEEMAKKSAIRRLAKRLPLSVDIHDLIQRDNQLFDLEMQPAPSRPSLSDRLKGNTTPQLTQDAREGFSATFDRGEPEFIPAGEFDDNTNTDDIPSSEDTASPVVSEPEGSAPSHASGSSLFDDDDAKPTAKEMERLRAYAKDVLNTAGNPSTTADLMKKVEGRWASEISGFSQPAKNIAGSIARSVRAIMRGDTSAESAIMFHAEGLGVEPEEIGGAA